MIRTEIAEPLGLTGLFCGVPTAELGRCAQLKARGFEGPIEKRRATGEKARARAEQGKRILSTLRVPWDPTELVDAMLAPRMEEVDFNSPEFRQASVPAANGMFTARSLARMYACLAHGGELEGVRLLSEAQMLRATQIQNRTIGRVMPIPMHWRLGYHRVFTVRAKAPAAFGHFGFGGSGAWADPERDLSAALTVNSGVGTPFGDSRIARVSGAVIRSADRR